MIDVPYSFAVERFTDFVKRVLPERQLSRIPWADETWDLTMGQLLGMEYPLDHIRKYRGIGDLSFKIIKEELLSLGFKLTQLEAPQSYFNCARQVETLEKQIDMLRQCNAQLVASEQAMRNLLNQARAELAKGRKRP